MPVASHTPGPWGMETVRTSCGVCHKIGPWPHKWRAGTTMSACIYDDYPSPPEGTDTMLANARLIAAAPDLKECGADLLASLDPDQLNPEQFNAWCRLNAAIAKADPASLQSLQTKEEAI